MGKEVHGRLGDGELAAGKHEGVHQVSIDYREEWRLQVGPLHWSYAEDALTAAT